MDFRPCREPAIQLNQNPVNPYLQRRRNSYNARKFGFNVKDVALTKAPGAIEPFRNLI
jgi:hypothetical protein